jgi:hypothetical protein
LAGRRQAESESCLRKGEHTALDLAFSDFGTISAVGWARSLRRSKEWVLHRHVNSVVSGDVKGAEAESYGVLQVQEGTIPAGRWVEPDPSRLVVGRLALYSHGEFAQRRSDYVPRPWAEPGWQFRRRDDDEFRLGYKAGVLIVHGGGWV